MNKAAVALVIVILVGGYQAWKDRVQSQPPGVLVNPTPVQRNFETTQTSIRYKDVLLDPLADFSLEGRVLSTKGYTLDRLAKIVPTDVAIGWGVFFFFIIAAPFCDNGLAGFVASRCGLHFAGTESIFLKSLPYIFMGSH